MDGEPLEDTRGHFLFATQSPKVVLGIICTMLVVLLWVGSSELSQYIFDNADYSKPFFMTALNTSLFSFYLLGFLIFPSWRKVKESEVLISEEDVGGTAPSDPTDCEATVPLLSPTNEISESRNLDNVSLSSENSYPMRPAPASNSLKDSKSGGSDKKEFQPIALDDSFSKEEDVFPQEEFNPSLCSEREDALQALMTPIQLPWYKVAELAAWFVWIWLIGGYLFNASLCFACGTGTSVSANQVISGTSALWALILSCIMLGEQANWLKLAAVLFSCAGAALITGVDFASGSGNSWQGDVMCALSAMCHGLSSVLLKLWIPHDEAVNMPMFFGFVGLFNTMICAPLLFLLDYTQIEPLQALSLDDAGYLAVNGILGTVVSNVLWARAVVLTSPLVVNLGTSMAQVLWARAMVLTYPLVVNLGTSMAIPLAFAADALNPYGPHEPLKWEYVVGAVMVVGAFLSVNITVEDSMQRSRARAISIGSSGRLVA